MAWCHAAAIKNALAYLPSGRTKIVIDKFDFQKTELRLERAKIKDEDIEIIQSSKGDSEIPVSVASIIGKHLFERHVDKLSKKFGVDLRTRKPSELDPKILRYVAKLHFKNIQGAR